MNPTKVGKGFCLRTSLSDITHVYPIRRHSITTRFPTHGDTKSICNDVTRDNLGVGKDREGGPLDGHNPGVPGVS